MTATVVILTFNAAARIEQVMTAVLRQQADFDWDLLVIDSGSHDSTLSTIAGFMSKHPGKIRLHQIANADFGHGKTRNLAARLAGGAIVVFLTHDAVPAHDGWLAAMVHPFAISERVACVYGRQIPWPRSSPNIKRDITNVFQRLGPNNAISIHEKNGSRPGQPRVPTFFSDVNSAIRRTVLLESVPFRDLAYAEDQAFGRDVLDAGLLKVYSPFAAVFHSHDYSLLTYYRRMYDEMLGLRRATGQSLDTSVRRHAIWVAKATLADWRLIMRDRAYSTEDKVLWFARAPFFNVARRLAIRVAASDRTPHWVGRASSLELSLKKGVPK